MSIAVNGQVYDAGSIKIMMPSGPAVLADGVDYPFEKESKVLNNARGVPRATIGGNFKGSFKITLTRWEFENLNTHAQTYGGIFNMPSIPVVISYGNIGQPPITDKLEVKITKLSNSPKKGEEVKVGVEGIQTAIPILNGKPLFVG